MPRPYRVEHDVVRRLDPSQMRGMVWRATSFFALWLILSGADPAGLPAGVVAVVAATWTSVKLLPAGAWRVSPSAMGGLLLRFLHQSVIAGALIALAAVIALGSALGSF